MFTGLIREIAIVESFNNNTLTLKANYKPKIGDSVAINGACLTVVNFSNTGFSVELSAESINVLAKESYEGFVHIEPAMSLGDRIEGHIVQGHIDCMGVIEAIDKNNKGWNVFIKVPQEQSIFMIPKGSVAVNGVSLTINSVKNNIFRLTIIPHTIENTLFKNFKIGQKLNIESDMFARYLYHIFNKEKKLSWREIDYMQAQW
jgi:riboflavin synthase